MTEESKDEIFIKAVGGQTCTATVYPDTTVADVKALAAVTLGIPVVQQKLLHKGRPLADSKKLSEYNVPPGATLYVLKYKDSQGASSSSPSTSSSSSSSNKSSPKHGDLSTELRRFLRGYFNDADVEKIVREYMADFNRGLSCLSLDDWERVAIRNLEQAEEASECS